MKFAESFKALGYELRPPRSDWSAEKSDGVCLSIWEKEIRPLPGGGCSIDTREDCTPIEGWGPKRGNKLRIRHLQRAMAEFSGRIDVVVVHGIPGVGYGSASPWQRAVGWRVIYFDSETGHYGAEVRPVVS